MLKLTMCMGSVARCTEKFVLLQNWSNKINIAQLLLKYGTMKLQVQSIRSLASIFFFLIPYCLWISVPLADFLIKIRIILATLCLSGNSLFSNCILWLGLIYTMKFLQCCLWGLINVSPLENVFLAYHTLLTFETLLVQARGWQQCAR